MIVWGKRFRVFIRHSGFLAIWENTSVIENSVEKSDNSCKLGGIVLYYNWWNSIQIRIHFGIKLFKNLLNLFDCELYLNNLWVRNNKRNRDICRWVHREVRSEKLCKCFNFSFDSKDYSIRRFYWTIVLSLYLDWDSTFKCSGSLHLQWTGMKFLGKLR